MLIYTRNIFINIYIYIYYIYIYYMPCADYHLVSLNKRKYMSVTNIKEKLKDR